MLQDNGQHCASDPDLLIPWCEGHHSETPYVEVAIWAKEDRSDLVKFKIGNYILSCVHCGEYLSEGPVIEGDNPPLEYIKEDWTGEFFTATPENIERLLKQAESEALKGESWTPVPKYVGMLTKLGERAGYPIKDRLDNLSALYERRVLENYVQKMPEEMKRIATHLEANPTFVMFEDEELGREMDPAVDEIARFLEKYPKIKHILPRDSQFREDVHFVLSTYRDLLFDSVIRGDREKVTKLQKDIEERKKGRLEVLEVEGDFSQHPTLHKISRILDYFTFF